MGMGDWIFLAALLLITALGALLGFGKVFSFFVLNKVVRIILAVYICYTFGGIILGIPFISQLLSDLAANWAHIEFLKAINLEIKIYYIALFLITMLVILILSKIIRGISESKLLAIRILNKIGGAILFGVLAITIMLTVFQVIAAIGGQTAADFDNLLSVKANAILRPMYENNPMLKVIDLIIK